MSGVAVKVDVFAVDAMLFERIGDRSKNFKRGYSGTPDPPGI
jgi:hypothetical protein